VGVFDFFTSAILEVSPGGEEERVGMEEGEDERRRRQRVQQNTRPASAGSRVLTDRPETAPSDWLAVHWPLVCGSAPADPRRVPGTRRTTSNKNSSVHRVHASVRHASGKLCRHTQVNYIIQVYRGGTLYIRSIKIALCKSKATMRQSLLGEVRVLLVREHEAIAGLAILERIQRVVDLLERPLLDPALHTVLGRDLEHLANRRRRADE
jgi:hypothetical protein